MCQRDVICPFPTSVNEGYIRNRDDADVGWQKNHINTCGGRVYIVVFSLNQQNICNTVTLVKVRCS